MRKLYVVLLVAAALSMMVFPALAQDDMDEAPGTIADIVVASATAEEGAEFATLLTAVQAADPAVLEALSDEEAALTVFAPTDAAFAALAEELGEEAFAAVLEDTEALTGILLFHVVDGIVTSEQVLEGLEAQSNFSGPTLNGQYIDVAGNLEDGITINGANLVLEMVDIEASNGVIHVIDAVILPESRTIAEIVVANAEAEEEAEFTTLLTAVGAADPAVLELLSDPEASLTVFAPTDAAFAALAEALGEEAFAAVLADTAALTDILQYHVVADTVYSGNLGELLLSEDAMLDDAGNPSIDVEMANGAVATVLVDLEANAVFINDAEIVITDIDAGNGVIHVIDAVILPPAEDEM